MAGVLIRRGRGVLRNVRIPRCTTFVRFQSQSTIPLQVSNPAMLLNDIAHRYENASRIVMEYVDNAVGIC